MEVSGVENAGLSGASLSQQSASSRQVLKAKVASSPVPAREDTGLEKPGRRGGFSESRGLALGALRKEIREALSSYFKFAASVSIYRQNSAAPGAQEVAEDALSAARNLLESSPLSASEDLEDIREGVESAANSVRTALGNDLEDVEEVLGLVEEGLDDIDSEAARNVESSSSFLSAESQLRRRSTIKIRTQEGDIVRLDLRYRETVSATDFAYSDNNTSFTSTEVALSTNSRLSLKVKGDLNDEELAAIQNVFTQAEQIAEDFYGGDIAAAFDAVSGLQFDSDQLARVNLRFREQQASSVVFAGAETVSTLPAPDRLSAPAAANPVAKDSELPQSTETDTAVAETPLDVEIPAVVQEVEPEVSDPAARFVDMLGDFLQSTQQGFETGDSKRYFYSESFRLQLLKTVIEISAPEKSEQATAIAGETVDSVLEED